MRQKQAAVHKSVHLERAVVGENPNLTIVGASQRARVLTLDADRLAAFLGKAGLVVVADGIVIGQRFQDTATQLDEDSRILPSAGGNERLEVADVAAGNGLGDVLAIAALALVQQALDEATGMRLILLGAEQRGKAFEEAVEFRLQRQQLLLVHERPPGRRTGARQTPLVSKPPFP